MVVKEIENYEDDEEKIKSGFYRFCGFLMFYEKVTIDNRNDKEKNEEKKKKKKKKQKMIQILMKKLILNVQIYVARYLFQAIEIVKRKINLRDLFVLRVN